jgi:hypothetical protein
MSVGELETYLGFHDGRTFFKKVLPTKETIQSRSFNGELITPLSVFAVRTLNQEGDFLFTRKAAVYNPDALSEILECKFEKPQVLSVSLQFDSVGGYTTDWARLELGVEEKSLIFDVVSVNGGDKQLHFVAEYWKDEKTAPEFAGLARTYIDPVWCKYVNSMEYLSSTWKDQEAFVLI